MTRVQMAILPGMVTSFLLGRAEEFYGVKSEIPFIIMLVMASIAIYAEYKKQK
ncbi:hypothetical protein [Gayadomonas joobiniege]|uniref:hypothetical protein n=1 Tax=Gayadomonas joobiniege TaxID=1234606 RepID=UPI0003647994|nr:hypothetical protein [Gayadomonas joobiniege]